MLRITNLSLSRGTRRLLEGANLSVHAGHKVGLVGANGGGKSSLFAAIRHEGSRLPFALRAAGPIRPRERPFGLMPDAGSIDLPASWTIAHVAQETPPVERSAIDYVLDGDIELREIEAGLAAAETEGAALAELHHRYEVIGGYGARARAATLLAGLGFAEARHGDSVASFSGGWRMRLNLAQALQSRSDLLLLDEPTNHLDLDAVLWLEDWLGKYPGTLLLITHDRDFLDGVVGSIAHIDNRKLVSYTGNYAQFELARAHQLALTQATYAKQQRQIAHLQSFVDRFRAKATKAKQAQSRLKAIERMELIAAAHVDSPFEFAFAPVASAARQLVLLEHAVLGYQGRPPVLDRLDFG
ncbi:MAG: ATP-binding cassette domain-containing protein, partial [Casimicrobiaceae bacterium]